MEPVMELEIEQGRFSPTANRDRPSRKAANRDPASPVRRVGHRRCGDALAAGRSDRLMAGSRVCETDTDNCRFLNGHTGPIESLAFDDRAARSLLSASRDGTFRTGIGANGCCRSSSRTASRSRARRILDGERVATGDTDGTIKCGMSYPARGCLVLTGPRGNTRPCIQRDRPRPSQRGRRWTVSRLAAPRDVCISISKPIAAPCRPGPRARRTTDRDGRDRRPRPHVGYGRDRCVQTISAGSKPIGALLLSPESAGLVLVDNGGRVQIHRLGRAGARPLGLARTHPVRPESAISIALLSGGTTLAIGGRTAVARLWEI